MAFQLLHTDSECRARAGVIQTAHGSIDTPIFMPVGTRATVKATDNYYLDNTIGAQIILGNTYHLYLRPGSDIIESAGGLHKFMDWKKPILTDSGGYQVYSLGSMRKISEEGVMFNSHIDGSRHFFTPENVVKIQKSIGADIIMAFDECPPYPSTYAYAMKSMKLTHRWLDRCLKTFHEAEGPHAYSQVFAPIVQGSVFKDLRRESCAFVAEKNSPINAIGGLSVGEPHDKMYEITDQCTQHLPLDKARYLMGVGLPENILDCISLGVDMFDCVLPSRNARHGILYTAEGLIHIKNARWKDDFSPIDETSPSPLSRNHSKAYLRHLFLSKEILASQIATVHNLSFYLWLVKTARLKIIDGTFLKWKNAIIPKLKYRL